jgi:hypothetical protein
MEPSRVFKMSFANIYPHYIQKAEKKGRTNVEEAAIICWLTDDTSTALQYQLDIQTDFQTFITAINQLIDALSKGRLREKNLRH